MKRPITKLFFLLLVLVIQSGYVQAQSTEFTYQGSLQSSSVPANGNFDFEFLLFDAAIGGTQIGPTLTRINVPAAAGTFAVRLDFGGQFPGANRFIEIHVRTAGGGAYTPLAPRQPVSSSPYSVQSLNAANAANSTQLGGVAANQYILTGDARLSDARSPLPNSTNYIQNTTIEQTGNFAISGNGIVGGSLSAYDFYAALNAGNIVSARQQYNIGLNNTPILSAPNNNTFLGIEAGSVNSVGDSNAFFGRSAGKANTFGNENSFFGRDAGAVNTTSSSNSFFGANAGKVNAVATSGSFFGANAGQSNTTGDNNSFFGRSAGQANTTGVQNSFFGRSAGLINTIGNNNSFFGLSAGENNSTGGANSFFGLTAGQLNSTGFNNSFFGVGSGGSNTVGTNLTMLGLNANVGPNNLTYATAIGAGAVISNSNAIQLGRANGSDSVLAPGPVLIGTTTPSNAKLQVNGRVRVVNGDVFISNPNTLIITSPNGACWGITVNNSGGVSTFATTCP